VHGPACGHVAIEHGDHIGFLVDGEMECFERGEHALEDLCFDTHEHHDDERASCCINDDNVENGPTHIHAHHISRCQDGSQGVSNPDPVHARSMFHTLTRFMNDACRLYRHGW